MKETNNKILSSNLEDLIGKFSREDVIEEMEKEYQSAPSRLISPSAIEDNHFIEEVLVPPKTIDNFAQGLKEKGLYNPLVVTQKEKGRYELVLGRKRFLGAKKAGLVSLPCAVIDISEEEMLLMLLADTRDQREGNVVEMALVYQALISLYGYKQQTLADLSHQSRCQVTNTLRILKLPRLVRDQICLGKLSYGHGRAVASLPADLQEKVLKQIKDEHLSVRESEKLVQSLLRRGEKEEEIASLKTRYGAEISMTEKKVSFSFSSKQERDEFLRRLDS